MNKWKKEAWNAVLRRPLVSLLTCSALLMTGCAAMPAPAPAPAAEEAAPAEEAAAPVEEVEAGEAAAEVTEENPEEAAATVEEVEAAAEAAAAEITEDSGYEAALFDTSYVHTIDVTIAPEDWELQLAEPTQKEKFRADVTIDGETFEEISFATKGNSSLYLVAAMPDSDRYSYRINFGKYIDEQTYHGLDKLSLNNIFNDATYMKDYISYGMFRRLGVDAPLTSFVWLSVNGEDRGLYMAVEDLDKGHLKRVYGGDGVIYKPEDPSLSLTEEDMRTIEETGAIPVGTPHGADLVYTDDNVDSYPDIMKNAETKAQDEDKAEVVAALKALSEGRPEDAFDTDAVIRFFAAHNFVLNYDSYTGMMLHNLVMVEQDGRLSFVPWDYNGAFGGFRFGFDASAFEDATDLLNTGIDTPLIRTTEEQRPAWTWIVADEDGGYREAYHAALDELIASYIESGEMEQEIDDVAAMIGPYVEKDPTAFCTAEEFRKAVEVLKDFNLRRGESVRRQLSGELAADSAQQADEDKVDAADLKIIEMCDNN